MNKYSIIDKVKEDDVPGSAKLKLNETVNRLSNSNKSSNSESNENSYWVIQCYYNFFC